MSIMAIANVLDDEKLTGNYRLLMLAVADGGGQACVESVCRWVNCDDRKARCLIADLIGSGYIEYQKDALTLVEDRGVIVSHWLLRAAYGDTLRRSDESGRKAIPKAVREHVRARDGDACQYCGDIEGPFHLDHVHPVSLGGENTPDNLVVACAKCNVSKGAKPVAEWLSVQ